MRPPWRVIQTVVRKYEVVALSKDNFNRVPFFTKSVLNQNTLRAAQKRLHRSMSRSPSLTPFSSLAALVVFSKNLNTLCAPQRPLHHYGDVEDPPRSPSNPPTGGGSLHSVKKPCILVTERLAGGGAVQPRTRSSCPTDGPKHFESLIHPWSMTGSLEVEIILAIARAKEG